MKGVVFIHGIGAGTGKSRAGFSKPLQKMMPVGVYYAEAIWEQVNDLLDAKIEEILNKVCAERPSEQVPAKNKWVAIFKEIIQRIKKYFAPPILANIIDRILDLPLYLGEPKGEKIRKIVCDKIHEVSPQCKDGIVLVAHSLGSVIAYDILRNDREKELNVIALITIGSPLQWVKDLCKVETGFEPSPLQIPWKNLYYKNDPIVLSDPPTASYFPDVENIEMPAPEGKKGLKIHTAYWEDPTVSHIILSYLKNVND